MSHGSHRGAKPPRRRWEIKLRPGRTLFASIVSGVSAVAVSGCVITAWRVSGNNAWVLALALLAAGFGGLMIAAILAEAPAARTFDTEPLKDEGYELSEENSVGYQPGR